MYCEVGIMVHRDDNDRSTNKIGKENLGFVIEINTNLKKYWISVKVYIACTKKKILLLFILTYHLNTYRQTDSEIFSIILYQLIISHFKEFTLFNKKYNCVLNTSQREERCLYGWSTIYIERKTIYAETYIGCYWPEMLKQHSFNCIGWSKLRHIITYTDIYN